MSKPFDIMAAYVAYVQTGLRGKYRPILVLRSLKNSEILRSLVITSKKGRSLATRRHRYPIKYWGSCGLTKPSYVDIKKHCTLVTSAFKPKYIGHLQFDDIIQLLKFIRNYRNDEY